MATTVTGTVSLTLWLLGDYEISQGEPEVPSPLPADPSGREETLAALAEELAVESLVFGEVLPPEDEELPDVDLVAEEQDRARRQAEERLQEALRVLEVARLALDARGTTAPTPPNYTGLPATRRMYLSAHEYIDSLAIRGAATDRGGPDVALPGRFFRGR